MEEIDHIYTQEIVCPYCGEEVGDSWEYPEVDKITCGKCEKQFIYHRDTDVTYTSNKIY